MFWQPRRTHLRKYPTMYDRPIFFIYLLALEKSPSNFLGATSNRWPADFAAPRAWKRRFQAQGKLFTLAGWILSYY